jgi:hypothetical protein
MSETYDNPNSKLNPQDESHELAKIGSEEYYDEKPDFSISTLDLDPEDDVNFNHGEASAQVFDEFCDELDQAFPEFAPLSRDERRVETIEEIWGPFED